MRSELRVRAGRVSARRSAGTRRHRRSLVVAAGSVAALITLAACSTGSGSDAGNQPANHTASNGTSTPALATTPVSTPTPDTSPAAITAAPAGRAINPKTPVTIKVAHGTLTSVVVSNPQGKHVKGTLSSDRTTWTSSEDLGYSKTYKIAAAAVNGTGLKAAKNSSFTTLTPDNMTMPYLQRTGGYGLTNGATYGVGIVPVVHFDEHVTNKAAAEKALKVTTVPHIDGSWYWADDQNVHWRPKTYYPSGTKVTIAADVYGVNVGGGIYGQADKSLTFKIGAKHVTIADDNAPKAVNKVRVYFNDKLVRTMNTSMGRHSTQTTNGVFISFFTLQGTYTVLTHENPAIMSSASYGLPANAPGGYAPEKIYYATKISTDGTYLHQLNSTVWDQDHGRDVSHGCLNLNLANAKWFYEHSQIGDVVIAQHTGGPTIAVWQNGDWSVPWSKWVAGSALS